MRAEKKNSEGVWLACSAGVFFGRANVFARESSMMAATTIRTRTRFRPSIGVFPALLLRAAHASRFFVHFFAVNCTTTRENA